MLEFVTGTLPWLALVAFVVGVAWRLVRMTGLARRDKVIFTYLDWRWASRSIGTWLVPYRTFNMRRRPAFTFFSFLFHVCLLGTPLFLLAHVVYWERAWGFAWPALPAWLADAGTFVVLAGGLVFLLRRIADPTTRYVTSAGDYGLLAVVLAPFVTGLLARYQVLAYEPMLVLHILSGVVWLVAIPFTRISHMIFFPLTRGYMGSEFGFRHARDW